MKKVIKKGNVAILYSPGYGAGWYSWNTNHKECIFNPTIVNMVLAGEKPDEEFCKRIFGEGFYAGGASDLQVKWLPKGTHFTIEEYDGYESITTLDSLRIVA